jgi:hypothetical protein
MIVFETIFASLYGYLWEGRWPTVLEGVALALLVAGVVMCARAHRSTETGGIKPAPDTENVMRLERSKPMTVGHATMMADRDGP